MPPREDGATPKSFTWITGNPRSRKNITQIRRHAGQNSGVKAENCARAQSSSSPKPGQRSSAKPSRAIHPLPRTYDADGHPPSAHAEQAISPHVHYPPAAAEFAPAPSLVIHEQVVIPQPGHPDSPSAAASASISEDVAPTRKLAIWDLVNHSVEEEEQHTLQVLASTPGRDTEDNRQGYFSGRTARAELKQALSEARSDSPPHTRKSTPPPPTTFTLQANVSKRRKATSSATSDSHVSWRLGMPPSPRLMSLTKEDSQIEQTLLRTSAFFWGQFESSWSAQLRERGNTYFDKISGMESFAGSITTAGGLLALGQVDSASSILDSALPKLPELLTSQHPQVCWLFADLSLSASSDTALGRLRSQVKRVAASASHTTLGPSHPITKLLHLTFPATAEADAQRLYLRELIQRRIHELHESLFEPNSYQTTGQYYYLARVLGQVGQLEKARDILAEVVAMWEAMYGVNHIMPITGLLELTRAHLSLNDASTDTEALLSEALRRTLTLEKATATASQDPTSRTAGLTHSRIGCLRTLGRLHVMRGNLATALMQYTAAMSVGVEELGVHVPAVQLALADLDAVSQMVRAHRDGDESVRLEWLKRVPVEVGIRWVNKNEGSGAMDQASVGAEKLNVSNP
ncbi:hypothetical protein A1O7_06392 [Cladophialophora yegresii CBS 114405]|uniref:MalT-like TPR region domain-containing protein n=1 Tax=Cladophialophora yegresii CBS 114405 TaxID=1182544 RepID=W9W345_9EURO|nr:uncharacterized protein A1O7_06392 [Cladophialophora yegresii CBS 114405]EXJ58961.1 hypothetical protein A1O7_06392 [Cladophialophora yegresii CBS 114405]